MMWKERCAIITKMDHQDYTEAAKHILHSIIDNLPLDVDHTSGGYYSFDSVSV